MREIEIKAKVADKRTLLDMLAEQNVVLGDPIIQHDRVFGLDEENRGGHNSLPWLRIRTETKKGVTRQIFTLKKSVTNQLDSIEHETEIADEAELENIILQLGFAPYSDLTKTRRKALVGEIEVCFDVVKGLGDFIEVEKLTADESNYEEVAKELWAVLERFGVKRQDEVTDGYDVMMKKLEAQS